MSNIYKVIIAIIAIVILTGVAGIFLNSQSRQSSPTIANSSSSLSAFSSQVSQVRSTVSSSQVASSLSPNISSVSNVVSKVVTTQSTETIDGVQITNLDSKNPPQYIKDYFGCETKKPKGSNVFIKEGQDINFYCPPIKNCEIPKQVYQFNYDTKKWNCSYGQDGIRGCIFGIDIFDADLNLKSQIISKINFEEQISGLESCFLFTNKDFSNVEITLINKIFPNKKLIIYK